jgi:hypothetical protein
MLVPAHFPLTIHTLKIVHPRRSGLHLGNVDYVNTLKVVAAPKRRGGEEAIGEYVIVEATVLTPYKARTLLRAAIGASPAR